MNPTNSYALIAVWDYLGSRLKVAGNILVQPFDRYVRARFRPA
jgi:hypothetical protein